MHRTTAAGRLVAVSPGGPGGATLPAMAEHDRSAGDHGSEGSGGAVEPPMSLTPLSSVWIVGAVMVGVGLVVVFAFDAPGVARAMVAMIVLGVSIVVGFAILDRTRLAPVRRLVAQSQPVDAGRIEPQATTVRHLAVQALVLGTVGLLGLFMEQPAAIGVCWVVAGLGLVVPMRRIRRYELGNGVLFLVEPLSVRLRHWRRRRVPTYVVTAAGEAGAPPG